MKWPFSRKNNVDNVPQEIQEYYQSERRERTGVAWLLALGTLLTTIALATALFFGGRWVYRTVVDRGDGNGGNNGASTQVQQDPSENQAVNGDNDGTGTTENQAGQESAPADQNGGQSEGTVSDSAATDSREPAVPATGDSLPDTGPGDMLAVFMIVTAAGALGHHAVTTRRS